MIRKGLEGGSYKPLTPEDISRINETVLRIIEEIGCEVNSNTALVALEKVGANVDRENHRVRLSREKALELISKAPSEVTLCGRNEKNDIHLGGSRVYTGTGGTALYIYEPGTGERRQATLDDLKNIARLVEKLDNIHLFLHCLHDRHYIRPTCQPIQDCLRQATHHIQDTLSVSQVFYLD